MNKTQSIYDTVTGSIIAAIEASPGPCRMPWHRSAGSRLHLPRNATTERSYNGINILVLWIAAQQAGHSAPLWASYKQWSAVGAQVRGGERATRIIFYKQFTVEPDGTDSEDDGHRRVTKTSSVWCRPRRWPSSCAAS